MKSTASTLIAFLVSLSAGLPTYACDITYTLPKPSLFCIAPVRTGMDEKEENLRLWQRQTSPDIPLSDIEEVIYGDLEPECYGPFNTDERGNFIWEFPYNPSTGKNKFLNYLANTQDKEALNIIMMAKHIEKLRDDRNSPWYYPSSKTEVKEGFVPAIQTIKAYSADRFRDRYSLQLIRALFASGRYEECIQAFKERFASVQTSNLMKRLSEGYAAGAAIRLDKNAEATAYFAAIGDIESLEHYSSQSGRALALAIEHNPDAPKLHAYIHQQINGLWLSERDSTDIRTRILPAAYQVLRQDHVQQKAVWHYTIAFIEGEFNHQWEQAARHIAQAYTLADDGPLKEHIHSYRMVIDARRRDHHRLLSDLQWLESKVTNVTTDDYNHWIKVVQSIVLKELVSAFDREGQYVLALQLANFGTNLPLLYRNTSWYFPFAAEGGENDLTHIRKSSTLFNPHDYSNAFFLYANRQSRQTLETYIASLSSTQPLSAYLNAHSYTHKDYLYDLAGTLALRSRDYASAVRLLGQVAPGYQSHLNVDKKRYLRRDPFTQYTFEPAKYLSDTCRIKWNFAREMLALKQTWSTEKDGNRKAQARIRYAIGLDNSFNHCWALTHYYQGYGHGMILEDDIYYNADDIFELSEQAHRDAQVLIDQALTEFTHPEDLARTHLQLQNYRTIAQHYPYTQAARFLQAHCDQWADWCHTSGGE